MRVENAVNIADLGMLAKRRLPKVIFDFMDGGAEDEVTLRGNRQGFERYRFRPRLLTGNAKRDLSVNLFGEKFATPFLIGPTGLNGIHWRDGDLALANAAAAAGCGFVLSTASTNSIEEVGQSSTSPKWFQLYPWGDRAHADRFQCTTQTQRLLLCNGGQCGRRDRQPAGPSDCGWDADFLLGLFSGQRIAFRTQIRSARKQPGRDQ